MGHNFIVRNFLLKYERYILRTFNKIIFGWRLKRLNCTNFFDEVLDELTLIDVGASYFLPDSWRILLKSKKTHLVCIEQNAYNLEYLTNLSIRARVSRIPSALSANGGTRTLFKTNVDSGSSLFLPRSLKPIEHQLNPSLQEYFFPIEKMQIETITLGEVMKSNEITSPVLIKLDIQGAELEVLQSIKEILKSGLVVGIETEASLLSDPLMIGSSKFANINLFLAECGFELLNLKPIFTPSEKKSSEGFLNECDSFYILAYNSPNFLSINQKMAIFVTYISYGFPIHAQALVDVDIELQSAIYKRISPVQLSGLLRLISKYGLSYF